MTQSYCGLGTLTRLRSHISTLTEMYSHPRRRRPKVAIFGPPPRGDDTVPALERTVARELDSAAGLTGWPDGAASNLMSSRRT
jgi:hypothetical protein